MGECLRLRLRFRKTSATLISTLTLTSILPSPFFHSPFLHFPYSTSTTPTSPIHRHSHTPLHFSLFPFSNLTLNLSHPPYSDTLILRYTLSISLYLLSFSSFLSPYIPISTITILPNDLITFVFQLLSGPSGFSISWGGFFFNCSRIYCTASSSIGSLPACIKLGSSKTSISGSTP